MLTWYYHLMFWICGKRDIEKISLPKVVTVDIQTFLDHSSIANFPQHLSLSRMIYNSHEFFGKTFFAKKVLTSAVSWLSRVSPSKFCFRTNQGTSVPSYMFLLRSKVSYIFQNYFKWQIIQVEEKLMLLNSFLNVSKLNIQGPKNCAHGDKRARNLYAKWFLHARN